MNRYEQGVYRGDWDSDLWARFLEARMALIDEWDRKLAMSPVTMAGQLSMDEMQARLLTLEARRRRSVKPNGANSTAALYAFMGWLTSRLEPVTFSSADLIEQFRKVQGWDNPADGWEKEFVPMPED